MEDQDRRWGSGFEIEERQRHRDLTRDNQFIGLSHNAPEKITTVSIPDLKFADELEPLALFSIPCGGLGVVGLEGMGVVERLEDIDTSFCSFSVETQTGIGERNDTSKVRSNARNGPVGKARRWVRTYS